MPGFVSCQLSDFLFKVRKLKYYFIFPVLNDFTPMHKSRNGFRLQKINVSCGLLFGIANREALNLPHKRKFHKESAETRKKINQKKMIRIKISWPIG